MSSNDLNFALLRLPVIQILRAAGFHSTKPAVLDTLTDLAARYLTLLATRAAFHARNNRNEHVPDLTDVRLALTDVGALKPQMSMMEEIARREEDLRGLEAFTTWCAGEACREIRRVAGMMPVEGEVLELVEGLRGDEDFLTALKKKHSKTGEEARYQGTVLGKEAEDHQVTVEGGGEVNSIQAWEARQRAQVHHHHHREASESPLTSPETVMATPTETGSTPPG